MLLARLLLGFGFALLSFATAAQAETPRAEIVVMWPENWTGLTEADHAASMAAEVANLRISGSAQPTYEERQSFSSLIEPALRLVNTGRSGVYPHVACAQLADAAKMISAEFVLSTWRTTKMSAHLVMWQDAELSITMESLGVQLRDARIFACEMAFGATSKEARAARSDRDEYDRALGRKGDQAPVFESVYRFSNAPLDQRGQATNVLLQRASVAALYKDRAAFDRDIAEIRRLGDGKDMEGARPGGPGISDTIDLLFPKEGSSKPLRAKVGALRTNGTEDDLRFACMIEEQAAARDAMTFEDYSRKAEIGGCKTVSRKAYHEMIGVAARTIYNSELNRFQSPLFDASAAAKAWPLYHAVAAEEIEQAKDRSRLLGARRGLQSGLANTLLDTSFARWRADADAVARDDGVLAMQEILGSGLAEASALHDAKAIASSKGYGPIVEEYLNLAGQDYSSIFTPVPGGYKPSPQAKAALDSEASRFRRLSDLEKQIERDHPEFFELFTTRTLTLPEIQAVLEPEEALVLIAESRNQVMVVTRDDFQWNRYDIQEAILARSFLRLMWDLRASFPIPPEVERLWRQTDASRASFDREGAHRLYQAWFGPFEGILADKTRLLTVTEGIAATIPLSVLVTEAPAGADNDFDALRKTRWLIDRWSLVALPSIDAMVRERSRDGREARPIVKVVGIGNPSFKGEAALRGTRRARIAFPSSDGRTADHAAIARFVSELNGLPGTQREMEMLRSRFGKDALVVTGRDASESTVKAMDWQGADIAAFATHGLVYVPTPQGLQSGLAFSAPTEPGEQDDGFLSAAEAATLDIPVEWLILSACDTATGYRFDTGSQYSGLLRAFRFAGARSILASFWPVQDRAAEDLVRRTLDFSSAGSRADALRKSMVALKRDPSGDGPNNDGFFDSYAHPNAWAPFMLFDADGRY